jgi:glyoxylase-like metal-dependent hydrolase (beta-lactamase superfamily II)
MEARRGMHPEFEPGRVVPVADGVVRLLAPNASRMTGPGTNTYLLGNPPHAALDPGPDNPGHVAAILRAAPALDTVIVTHTHSDHSPAARTLARRSGARLVGRPPPSSPHQDLSFAPQHVPRRDELIRIDAGLTLRAIDTPGHASNHVCFLLEEQGMLFSGDHVLDGMTPVILAPDGDMAAYLEALERLLTYPLRAIAPAHGRVLPDPRAVIEGLIAHRLRREAKVAQVLANVRSGSLEMLLPVVYGDVAPELHDLARYSLEAHLIKLERDGRCRRDGDHWHAV